MTALVATYVKLGTCEDCGTDLDELAAAGLVGHGCEGREPEAWSSPEEAAPIAFLEHVFARAGVPEGVRIPRDTPLRMAKALAEMVSGYGANLRGILKTFRLEGDSGVVAVRDLPFSSLCEHHVLPFTGTASIAYIPTDRIVGLSKLPRVLRAVTRRLQVQERIGQDIADALMMHVRAAGAMVVVRGRHSCMSCRGVESTGEMVTSCVRGVFRDDASARAEALALIG